jgi:acyl-coenzyme A thioesterase PaaI-like protein
MLDYSNREVGVHYLRKPAVTAPVTPAGNAWRNPGHESNSNNPHSWINHHMNEPAFQDYYPDELSHCYGCGRLNEQGLQLKSRWDGEETVAVFHPRAYHIAIPGYVYGGLLASLIDCHGTGTASAAAYREAGRPMGSEPPFRFVTASLQVDYLRPTPMGVPLEIRGRVQEVKGRKVVVSATVTANGVVYARGQVVAVQMPENMIPKDAG